VRLGITVTRKVGNAVRRNRIKRLVREWFRCRQQELSPCDLVVIAKRDFPQRATQQQVAIDLDLGLGLAPPSSSR
jgi:ribonuclease P protein component